MESTGIVFDLMVIFLAALVGGSIAESLKQSPIIGYIMGGILAGPYTTGLVSDLEMVNSLADIGIILLMFILGIEFSLARMAKVKKIAIWGGTAQIVMILALGAIAGIILGFSWYQSVFLGCILSVSSTMIVLRVLDDLGEMNSLHGQIMISILIVQDLAVVLMVSVLPNLQKGVGNIVHVLMPLGEAILFVALMIFLAERVVPVLLERFARRSNNDIFLLVALSLVLGIALSSQAMGLSVSLGAFMAGLVVSQSEYAHEIMGRIIYLRDAFVVVFFVSVGLLINPQALLGNWIDLLVILAVILPGKFAVLYFLSRIFGYHSRVAFAVGLGMMQTGEFSFVMAKMGIDNGLISPHLYNLVLASALISIVVTPGCMRNTNSWYNSLRRFLHFRPEPEEAQLVAEEALHSHIIVLGCGRMGRNVVDGIQRLGLPLVALDYDYASIRYLNDRNINCIYGDASNPLVLKLSHPERASMAILTLPDAYHSLQAIQYLRKANPQLIILARAHNRWHKQMLLEAGATAVIQPESEAGFQMVRQIILNMELPDETLKKYLNSMYHADYDRVLRERGFEPAPKDQLRAEEFLLQAGSPLIGRTIRHSGIRENTGCNIAAIRREKENILVNPPSDERLAEGDILIAMGKAIELGKLRNLIAQDN
jgi:CPA2 family monovalent cation:H+ antiporter-2